MLPTLIAVAAVVLFIVLVALKSLHSVGPAQVGLVNKRVGAKLGEEQLVALEGEAGYQADLLMPGLRFKLWPIYGVERFDWVQVPPDHVGLVIAQVGAPLPTGAKSAVYRPEFGNFGGIRSFLEHGGQRGVQRPVLPPGTTLPIHPIGFVVVTSDGVFGKMVSESTERAVQAVDKAALRVVHITPQGDRDVVGVVTTLEGPPSGDIASRIGGFEDVTAMEANGGSPVQIIQAVLRSKNNLHDNYQDYQAFLANGGCIGLQHDPLLYGSYLLNPFLVKVELREMLVVRQGEVAVIKSYVGLPTEDTSGEEFKFGSIVKPGHQGIWSEPLRTGKYTLNPRIYEAEVVPTSILTLNWSHAHERRPQPRRPARPDRRQVQGGVHLLDRPAGADPRARHAGAEGHLDGRHDAEPRQRGARSRPSATTSATSCRRSARRSSSRSATRCSTPPRRTSSSTCRATRSRPAASTSRTSSSRRTSSRC